MIGQKIIQTGRLTYVLTVFAQMGGCMKWHPDCTLSRPQNDRASLFTTQRLASRTARRC